MAQIGERGERLDLLIRQGATLGPFPVVIHNPDGTPADLAGCEIRGALRKSVAAATAYPLTVDIDDPAAGRFVFAMPDSLTATIPCGALPTDPASLYVWDMEIEWADGTVRELFWGRAKIAAEVTQ